MDEMDDMDRMDEIEGGQGCALAPFGASGIGGGALNRGKPEGVRAKDEG